MSELPSAKHVGEREIQVRQLGSGYWHVRGAGLCNYSQPPYWPCDEAMLREHAHPGASEDFIHRAMQVSRRKFHD